jgi:alkanesulfonate monooxygenase SsuD/methylene tetrahydromethanopterin reductase-like flavin-dependent oxidoreductase (luciferase family)
MIGSADFPKISHVKKRAFLAAFSRCGSLSKAAKRARVDRRSHYNWLKDDPWYVQAFRQAVIEAGDSLQDKLTEMAYEGNVTAAIFLLKGLKPETFRDRIEQVNIEDIDPDKWTPEQLDKVAEALIQKALAGQPEAVVEEARRRIEAGETVTIEALEQDLR